MQKRKYRKGYHLDLGKNEKRQEIAQAHEQVAGPKSLKKEAPVTEELRSSTHSEEPAADLDKQELEKDGGHDRKAWRWRSSTEHGAKKVVAKVSEFVPKRAKSSKQTIPDQKQLDGSDSSEPDPKEIIALVAGILTWFFVFFGVVTAFFGIPFIGLLAIPCAIVAVIIGSSLREESSMAMIGYLLGLVYLVILGVLIAISLLVLLIFVIILLAVLG